MKDHPLLRDIRIGSKVALSTMGFFYMALLFEWTISPFSLATSIMVVICGLTLFATFCLAVRTYYEVKAGLIRRGELDE